MLGADVGTSLVTVVLSFDLSWLSPLLIFVGVVLFLARQADRIGRFGRVLIGLGLIIFALQWISVAAKPVVQAAGVKVIFASLTGDVLLDMLVAALLTMLCYSSLAVVLLVATLASLHVIAPAGRARARAGRQPRQRHPRHAVDAELAARGAARHARQLPVQADRLRRRRAVRRRCRAADRARSALGAAQEVVLFHLAFNVALAVAFIFFTAPIARIAERLLPDEARRPTTRRSRATSIRPRSTRRRSRSPAPRARRCASATSSSRC